MSPLTLNVTNDGLQFALDNSTLQIDIHLPSANWDYQNIALREDVRRAVLAILSAELGASHQRLVIAGPQNHWFGSDNGNRKTIEANHFLFQNKGAPGNMQGDSLRVVYDWKNIENQVAKAIEYIAERCRTNGSKLSVLRSQPTSSMEAFQIQHG